MSKESEAAARESDQSLIDSLIVMRGQEIEIITRSLVYLNEVFRRKLDLKRGQDSLYKFAEIVLGYDSDMAYPRIRAAEVLRFAPEFEDHLREGRISMTALKQAQVAFRAEDQRRKGAQSTQLRSSEKVGILKDLLGASTRKVGRLLAERFPSLDRERDRESVRPISGNRYVLQIVMTDEEYEDLQRLKEITAHTNPEGKNGVVIGRAVRQCLVKAEAKRKRKKRADKEDQPAKNESSVSPDAQRDTQRQIPVSTQREVYAKAGEQCQYVSPEGVRCQCRYGTQIEHALPIAFGGTDDPDNLELLCRAHNGYRAWTMGLRPPAHVQGRFSDSQAKHSR